MAHDPGMYLLLVKSVDAPSTADGKQSAAFLANGDATALPDYSAGYVWTPVEMTGITEVKGNAVGRIPTWDSATWKVLINRPGTYEVTYTVGAALTASVQLTATDEEVVLRLSKIPKNVDADAVGIAGSQAALGNGVYVDDADVTAQATTRILGSVTRTAIVSLDQGDAIRIQAAAANDLGAGGSISVYHYQLLVRQLQ